MKNTIKVSSTNSSGKNDSAIRVYCNDNIVAEVVFNKRNPLGYLQDRNSSKYLIELRDQLVDAMNDTDLTIEDCRNIVNQYNLNMSF